jgi:flagellar biogenesis protein FliO
MLHCSFPLSNIGQESIGENRRVQIAAVRSRGEDQVLL